MGVSRERIEFRGEGEILFGQPAGVVRGERERDLVPTDVDVGVMAGFFGGARATTDLTQRLATFRSDHPSGTNFLLCNGSVRFLGDNRVSIEIYRAHGSRDGGEVVTLD